MADFNVSKVTQSLQRYEADAQDGSSKLASLLQCNAWAKASDEAIRQLSGYACFKSLVKLYRKKTPLVRDENSPTDSENSARNVTYLSTETRSDRFEQLTSGERRCFSAGSSTTACEGKMGHCGRSAGGWHNEWTCFHHWKQRRNPYESCNQDLGNHLHGDCLFVVKGYLYSRGLGGGYCCSQDFCYVSSERYGVVE